MEKHLSARQKTETKNVQSYENSLGLSLSAYAELNSDFCAYAEKKLKNVPSRTDLTGLPKLSSPVLLPADYLSAQKKLDWLLCWADKNPAAKSSLEILAASVRPASNEIIKPLIFGIVGLAIIGPTLGLISRKKVMSILVERKIAAKSKTELLPKVVQASHSILAAALSAVDGDARQLEPEMLDWFWGERGLQIYESSLDDLLATVNELKKTGADYALLEQDGKPAVLAISPAVNTDYLDSNWDKLELPQA